MAIEKVERVLKVAFVFLLGFLSCSVLFYVASSGFEMPLGLAIYQDKSNLSAPSNWVSEDNIHVYNDKLVLDVKGISLSRYASTGSMKPVFDENANGIRVVPVNESQIQVGDIVSFKRGENMIVHRIVEKGIDENGIYFITKGDSNQYPDEKIRFKDIAYVTIGVLY